MGKPFSPRELTARVKVILKRSGQQNNETLSETEFIIDNARCRISYHDHWLDLTRYEFELLRLLLRQPERIYSRTQIMDLVWNEPEESLERAVDTHIKTLRAKLREIQAEQNPIKTHRGMGYSISASSRET
jgi:two-component system catabolic regulation response regulator CreB